MIYLRDEDSGMRIADLERDGKLRLRPGVLPDRMNVVEAEPGRLFLSSMDGPDMVEVSCAAREHK